MRLTWVISSVIGIELLNLLLISCPLVASARIDGVSAFGYRVGHTTILPIAALWPWPARAEAGQSHFKGIGL